MTGSPGAADLHQRPSSSRTIPAPATIAWSLRNASCRGRYFIPQSGATTSRSGRKDGERPPDPSGDDLGRLGFRRAQVEDAEHDHLVRNVAQDLRVEIRLRGLEREVRRRALVQLAQEGIAREPLVDDVRVAEAGVEDRLALDPRERAVDRLERVLARGVGPCLQVRLVDLDDVRACRLEVAQLLVDRLRVGEREVSRALVVVVLGLLRHRERPGDGDLDPPVRDRTEQLDVTHLDRTRAPDRAHDARDRVRVARPVERDARVLEVDAVECRGEAIRVALAPHLPVGDDVDARELHVLHGEPGRVVLCFLEVLLADPPELERAHPRRQPVAEPLAVDEPVRLRVAPDDRREQRFRHRRRRRRRPRRRAPRTPRTTPPSPRSWTQAGRASRRATGAPAARPHASPRA